MAATKMTNSEFNTWLSTNINTNGNQDITGALLNEAFNNIVLSVLFADIRRDRNISVTGSTSNTITFDTPFPTGTEYTLVWRVRDPFGDDIGTTVLESNQTITGFTVGPATTGTLDYIAIEKY